ncbi:MAG: nucleotidyltransferase domain-containing protein [Ignavibacteriales bacterium]|nr:nucleotidyltransferase domain-containing protein [Ignavibacteriales bacterium]
MTMKSLLKIFSKIQKEALERLRGKLFSDFPVKKIIIYGSAVRNELSPESDIDLLIITKFPIDREERHRITDIVFEINLEFATNYSTLVVDENAWENGLYSVLPLKEEVLNEGIVL